MKVQYTKEYIDEYGQRFLCGWTAEHADAEAQRRIEAGVCIQVSDDARARKQDVVIEECITTPLKPNSAPAQDSTFKHKKNK